MGFVCLRAAIYGWFFGNILVFEIWFSEKLVFHTGIWPPGKKVLSGIRENLALQAALIRSPFSGQKETGCRKSISSLTLWEKVLPNFYNAAEESHAAFCMIDGQMISGKAEGVFFGSSPTTRILPFLQRAHALISMPVSLSIMSSMDFSESLWGSAD